MNLNINIEIKNDELVIFGNLHLKAKEANKFYLDNINIVVNFISDHSGKFNEIIIEEKDIVGNQKDEGTRFVRIS